MTTPAWDSSRAIAHRGWHDGETAGLENTMVAFQRAVDAGYRQLETDVQATADGQLVILHDSTLDRVTDGSGPVGAMTLADLSAVKVAGTQRIPLLAEVLDGFPQVRFTIDPKTDAAVGPLLDVLAATRAHERVCIGSFSSRRIRAVRAALGHRVDTALSPVETLRMWRRARSRRPAPLQLPPRVVAAQVPERFRNYQLLTPAFIELAHRSGIEVQVWTINDPADMHRLLDLGVDAVMTDRADVLKDVLLSRSNG